MKNDKIVFSLRKWMNESFNCENFVRMNKMRKRFKVKVLQMDLIK